MNFNIVQVIPDRDEPDSLHASCFAEVAEVLSLGLQDLGHDVIFGDGLHEHRVNIVLGYHLLRGQPLPDGYRCVVYQLEQLCERSERWGRTTETLKSASVIWDFSEVNIALLKKHGLTARYKPIGFHPGMMRIPGSAHKDIDVLFYGSLNDRRRKILSQLQRKFETRVLYGVYGEERDRWIARAKIVLDIHFYDTRLFDEVRLSYLLNNRVFVIVEETRPKKYQEFLIFSEYRSLVQTCEFYLQRPDLRGQWANKGFRGFSNYPEREFLKRAISESF